MSLCGCLCRSLVSVVFALAFGAAIAVGVFYLTTLPQVQELEQYAAVNELLTSADLTMDMACGIVGGASAVLLLPIFFTCCCKGGAAKKVASKKKSKKKSSGSAQQTTESEKKKKPTKKNSDADSERVKPTQSAESKRDAAKRQAKEERQQLETLLAIQSGVYRPAGAGGAASPSKRPPKGAAVVTGNELNATPAPAPAAVPKKKKKQEMKMDDGEWTTATGKKEKAPKPKHAPVAAAAAIAPGEEQTSIQVPVAAKNYGIIIGPQGATMKKIMEGSGASIEIPKKENQVVGASEHVIIRGTSAQVQACKAAIQQLLTKGYCKYTHENVNEGAVMVPRSLFGLVIGPGGSHIKAIQAKTGAKVVMPDQGSASEKVGLVGSKEQVKAAKGAIKQLVSDGFCPLTHPGVTMEELDIPFSQFAFVIGPRGQTIKSIQGDTKAQVKMPQPGDANQKVKVIGAPEAVARAVKQVQRALAKAEEERATGRARVQSSRDDESEEEPEYYDDDE